MNNIINIRCWFHLTIVVAIISALFLLIPILRQQQQQQQHEQEQQQQQHEPLHHYHHQFNSSSSSSSSSRINSNNNGNNIKENVDNENDRSIEMGAALFIAPFIKEFNRKYNRQEENSNNKAHSSSSSSSYCGHDYTSLFILEEWKNSHQELLCNSNYSNNNNNNDSTTTTSLIDSSEVENANTSMLFVNVKEYILQRWEGQPTIRRYSYSYSNINASSSSLSTTTTMMTSIITGSPLLLYNCSSITSSTSASTSTSASNNSTSRRHHHRPETATTTTLATSIGNEINNVTKPLSPPPPPPPTIIKIGPLFDIHNSYERFHAYLNLAMMMIMLDIRNPQLLIMTSSPTDVNGSNNKNVEDHEMWKLFSNQYEPIYQYQYQYTNNEFHNENEKTKTNTNATASSYTNHQIKNDELLLLLLQQQQQQHYGNNRSGLFDLIDASHITRSGLSILNTKIKRKNNDSHYESSKLKGGRAVDHHCNSILFQGIIEWIKIKIVNVVNVKVEEEEEVIEEDEEEEEEQQQNKYEYETETENEMNNSKDQDNTIIQILWSSRGPYCCQNNGQLYTPDRMIRNETLLINKIEHKLNNYIVDNNTSTNSSTNSSTSDASAATATAAATANYGNNRSYYYNITVVDFGTLSLYESIHLANKSHILVGIHGAGLIWSTFLLRKQQEQQKQQNNDKHNDNATLVPGGSTIIRPGLVEIFAGNRPPMNRHYHNLASLCNIQYQSTKHYWKGSNKYIRWTDNHVNEVVDSIKAIIIV